MGRALARLILVPLGCLLGVLAAAGVLLTLGLERATQAMHGGLQMSQLERLFEMVLAMPGLARVVSLVPAVLLVIIGEVARIRSATYYVIGGGAVLAILPLLSQSDGSSGAAKGILEVGALWQVFATAGFAGGFIYWLIAGRRA